MLGLMQDWPLTVDRVLDHAKANFPRREVVTRSVEGPISRTTYGNIWRRAKQVTNALRERGIGLGDRVATLGLEHRAPHRGLVRRDGHGRDAAHA
jgi:fatty-acyl-CoA synthase